MDRAALAQTVDHTLLKPEATAQQVAALVEEAAELGAFSICVSPNRLPVQAPDGLVVCTVVGFPSGAHQAEVKALEAQRAVRDGAGEVDMVVALGSVLAGDWGAVEADVAGVKASGGIRDTATALAMLDAGASRLGLSGTLAVLDGLPG